ncbi:MAG: hypothetical protein AB1512_12085 [Thermodesulfobacteriota bacterium]
MKDKKWVLALAVPAVVCILYGMARQDNPVFLVGLVFGIAAFLLYRKRYREFVREKYGERKSERSVRYGGGTKQS